MLGRPLSQPTSVVDSGSRKPMLNPCLKTRAPANERPERRLGFLEAAASQDFAAPVQPETGRGTKRIKEIAANADVAQLVEHFTRKDLLAGFCSGSEGPAKPGNTPQLQAIWPAPPPAVRGHRRSAIRRDGARFAAPLRHRFEPARSSGYCSPGVGRRP